MVSCVDVMPLVSRGWIDLTVWSEMIRESSQCNETGREGKEGRK
jgi:hypothetical protein